MKNETSELQRDGATVDAQVAPEKSEVQVLSPATKKTSAETVIKRIAEVSHAVGWQAGVGATEVAGQIISVLAANPQIIDRFMKDGYGTFIDGPISLDVVNGCLTYYAQTGELLSPGELHKRRGGAVQ